MGKSHSGEYFPILCAFVWYTDLGDPRDAFREMLESVTKNGHTFEECKQILHDSEWSSTLKALSDNSTSHSDIKLDEGFKSFYTWCKSVDIPVIIVSRYVITRQFVSFPRKN